MFFYHFDLLDDYIKNNFIYNVKQEQEIIDSILKIYYEKNEKFLEMADAMVEKTKTVDQKKSEKFSNNIIRIKKIFRKPRIYRKFS